MEGISHLAMTIEEVEHLVHQHKDGHAGGGENGRKTFRAGRYRPGRSTQCRDALIACDLVSQIDPRCLAPFVWIPRIADEDRRSRFRDRAKPRSREQLTNASIRCSFGTVVREMIERGQRVRLTAPKLGDEGEDRRSFYRLAREPPQHTPEPARSVPA